MRKAYIYYEDTFCGVLEENDEYVFTYADDYSGQPISLTMPLAKKIYRNKVLHPLYK